MGLKHGMGLNNISNAKKWANYGLNKAWYHFTNPKIKWANYGPKKVSHLRAEMGIGFREYLKCQKKRKMGLSRG
jgi:hypothetical protein